MNYPTEDQLRARELIAIFEGVPMVACEMVGRSYYIETSQTTHWHVSESGNTILRSDGFRTDIAELEERIATPDLFKADEFNDPFDVPAAEIPGHLTDEEADIAMDLAIERHFKDWDRDWEAQMERGIGY